MVPQIASNPHTRLRNAGVVQDDSAPALHDALAAGAADAAGALPPRPLLQLVSQLATLLHVHTADVLTQLLALAAHALAAAPAGGAQLAALEALMTPAADAIRERALTVREFNTYTAASAPVLFEAARTFEVLHWLLLKRDGPRSHAPAALVATHLRLVGLATRYDGDGGAVAEPAMPHFRAAVRRAMLEHSTALAEVSTPHNAVNALIHALRAIVKDLEAEAEVAAALPPGFVATSAAMRYRVVARAIEKAWQGAVDEARCSCLCHRFRCASACNAVAILCTRFLPADWLRTQQIAVLQEGVPGGRLDIDILLLDGDDLTATASTPRQLLYDERGRQLEDLLRGAHALLTDLRVARVIGPASPHAMAGDARAVQYLECEVRWLARTLATLIQLATRS
jgi:hypothetical protein